VARLQGRVIAREVLAVAVDEVKVRAAVGRVEGGDGIGP